MDKQKTSEWIRKRYSSLKEDFDTFLPRWRDVQKYIAPQMGRGLSNDARGDTNNGKRRDQYIVCGTATKALEVLVNGMFTGMTPRSRPWFHIQTGNMVENGPLMRWLFSVETELQDAMQRSNVYGCLKKLYGEVGAFGTGCLMVIPDARTGARCVPYSAGEFMLGTDKLGRVDTFYRESWWTVKQVAEEFGEAELPKSFIELLNNGKHETRVCVGNLIEPNDHRLPFPNEEAFPVRSVYYCSRNDGGAPGSGPDTYITIRGLEMFPVVAPRWSTVGTDSYGSSSPGLLALPDTMMLQKIRTKSLKALDKHVDPALMVNSNAGISEVNNLPGGLNFVTTMGSTPAVQPLYQTNPSAIMQNEQMVQNVQRDIQSYFFNDLFLAILAMPSSKRASATEIVQRNEEKLAQIGPVLETLDQELYEPLIQLFLYYMARQGMMPLPPADLDVRSLAGAKFGITYVSMLAQAQKAVGRLVPIEQTLQFAAQLAAFDPAVMDKIDADQMIDEYSRAIGCPPSTTRSDAETAEIRKVRAQMQMQQMQLQQAQAFQAQAQGAKALGEAQQITGGL